MALSELVDLAAERVGGAVLAASDEFFASRENLIKDGEAVFDPHAYVPTGKLMDGWESRRRRGDAADHDHAIVRLGLRGVVRRVVVDTAFFRGNYPAECALEACDAPGDTPVDALEGPTVAWRELVPRSALGGDRKNTFAIDDPHPVSHVRLRIYPDGGVARLRVLGDVAPAWDDLDLTYELVDLAALERGGRVVATSDMFFGDAQNMLLPGRSTHMGDGWETRRRRGPGHDWSIVALGAVGRLGRVEIDTQHFKGNAPGAAMLEGCRLGSGSIDHAVWSELLPRTPLMAHTRHLFDRQLNPLGPLSHVRISIYPDGGVARLRLWGRSERAERLMLGLQGKNGQTADERAVGLLSVCRSRRWADALALAFPFVDPAALVGEGERLWRGLDRADWLEAFAGHPRIGETGGGRWSAEEQSGTIGAAVATRRALAEANRAYEARYGHVFLVCATGKTAAEMLAMLETRMGNPPDRELAIAAEEQRKITRLRLLRWLSE